MCFCVLEECFQIGMFELRAPWTENKKVPLALYFSTGALMESDWYFMPGRSDKCVKIHWYAAIRSEAGKRQPGTFPDQQSSVENI